MAARDSKPHKSSKASAAPKKASVEAAAASERKAAAEPSGASDQIPRAVVEELLMEVAFTMYDSYKTEIAWDVILDKLKPSTRSVLKNLLASVERETTKQRGFASGEVSAIDSEDED